MYKTTFSQPGCSSPVRSWSWTCHSLPVPQSCNDKSQHYKEVQCSTQRRLRLLLNSRPHKGKEAWKPHWSPEVLSYYQPPHSAAPFCAPGTGRSSCGCAPHRHLSQQVSCTNEQLGLQHKVRLLVTAS